MRRVALWAIHALLVLSASMVQAQATFTVTNTNDSGNGSLRKAILDANADALADTIAFNIPGDGPHRIQPASALPFITAPLVLDGFTQPEAAPNTNALWEPSNATIHVVLDGSSAGSANGIVVQSAHVVVRGLAIGGFSIHGVAFEIQGGSTLAGCYVGTNAAGDAAAPNGFSGVFLRSFAMIGGPEPADRNVISGNANFGVHVFGGGASGTVVQGNYIGTNAAGTNALANSFSGLNTGSAALFGEPELGEAQDVIIGGRRAGEGNLISGNANFGVEVYGADNNGPTVSLGDTRLEGNRIGTNAAGTQAVGNTLAGILVRQDPTGVTIGGDAPGAGNLVSGNRDDGILIEISDGILVEGNFVGTDATGTAPLGNAQTGILLFCSENAVIRSNVAGANGNGSGQNVGAGIGVTCQSSLGITGQGNRIVGNWVGTDRTGTANLGNGLGGMVLSRAHRDETVGGTNPGEGNVIAFNNGPGVIVRSTISGPVSLLGNRIYSNREIGIDLEPAGVTANDAGDGDLGANNLQNFPEVASATGDGMQTLTIAYMVPTASAHAVYPLRVEFFLADSADPEGQVFLGSDRYEAADAEQAKTASFNPFADVSDGVTIVATATDADGNTSEFSDPVTVVGSVSTSIAAPRDEVPGRYALAPNYPNPFNPATQIRFALPQAAHARLTVYDVLGRAVAVLVDERLPAGYHNATFEAGDLPSGVYLYQLEAGRRMLSRTMLLLK